MTKNEITFLWTFSKTLNQVLKLEANVNYSLFRTV